MVRKYFLGVLICCFYQYATHFFLHPVVSSSLQSNTYCICDTLWCKERNSFLGILKSTFCISVLQFKVKASWHVEGNTFIKTHIKLQTPYEKLSVVEGSFIFTQNHTDSSVSLDFRLAYIPGPQIKIHLLLDGNSITVDMDLPIEGFRLVQFTWFS